ncbi:MAG: Receptor-coupling factor, CheW [Fibrobacteres bacterium]|nr:Receptor-coupling factor, CheW [Fibrobacterota bacterium]
MTATKIGESTAALIAKAGKYLTFQMGKEVYGIEILKVQEIIGMMPVTHVPKTPDFVRGVINLRGKVIPVIELRSKFGMEKREDTERTCIVVVQVVWSAGTVTMGMLVDEVSEVLNVTREQIEAPPSFGASVDTDFILGMGKVGQKVVMLLDVDKVLANEEIETLGKANTIEGQDK